MLTPQGLAYGAVELQNTTNQLVVKFSGLVSHMKKCIDMLKESIRLKRLNCRDRRFNRTRYPRCKKFGAGAWVRDGILRDASDQEINAEIQKHEAQPDFQMNHLGGEKDWFYILFD